MMNTQPELPKPPCPADATLYRSLAPRLRDGTLLPDEQKALRTHLRFCPSCREEAMAVSDQVIEEGVRRHYGIPANVPPFLTLDDIQRRVSLAPAPDTLHASATPNTDEIVGIDSRLNHRGKRMTTDENDLPTSPTESWPPQSMQLIPPNKTPNHWRTVAAGRLGDCHHRALRAAAARLRWEQWRKQPGGNGRHGHRGCHSRRHHGADDASYRPRQMAGHGRDDL